MNKAALISRVLAAVVGGYGLATIGAVALASLVPGPRAEQVMLAMSLSFAIYCAAAIWVFAVRSAGKAWGGLAVAAALAALVLVLVR